LGFEYGFLAGTIKNQYLRVEGPVEAYIFGYEVDNPSDKYFKKTILRVKEILDDTRESVYTENLRKAKEFFDDCIGLYVNQKTSQGSDTKSALKSLFDLVTTRLKFNLYILPMELNEYVVF